ncbi:YsgD/CorL family protein [Enterobacter oligotrophicus]
MDTPSRFWLTFLSFRSNS